LSGAVAQYGRGTGVIQGVATQLTQQFADNLKAMLDHEKAKASPSAAVTDAPAGSPAASPQPASPPPAPAAKPISGFALMFAVLRGMIAGLFTGRGRESR
jgi:uncharacterized protein